MKKKRGRKRRPNIDRTASGRPSEARVSQERLAVEAATWVRRKMIVDGRVVLNPDLTPDEARKPEHGSVIAMWLANHQGFAKRYPGQRNEHEFTQTQYDAALRYHQLYESWLAVISARRQRSASDFGWTGGYDGRDPFEDGIAKRQARIEADFKQARKAVLECGAPLAMMAIEAIVIENQPVENLRADLRCALNRLAAMWKIAQAA